MAFRELIGHVRQTVREALDHQDYPLLLMVQQSQAVQTEADPRCSRRFSRR